jgi:predicted DNA-binding ribbon-helix-helix protein
MYRTQILLDPDQHQALSEIARREKCSMSHIIREMLDKQIAERRRLALEAAAQALLIDYQNDVELTAFHALDGDDFHA